MPETNQPSANTAQDRIARKYKLLGYEVVQHPSSDHLPDFMYGVTPDIVARSKSDNVVIEVKGSNALKGSNDLVNIAGRISDHPDWRFELVVLDEAPNDRSRRSQMHFDRVVDTAKTASRFKMFGLAYVYLSAVMVGAVHDIAHAAGLKVGNRTDRDVLHDLGFKGVLPQDMMDAALTALALRDAISHSSSESPDVSEEDVGGLVGLCESMRTLL